MRQRFLYVNITTSTANACAFSFDGRSTSSSMAGKYDLTDFLGPGSKHEYVHARATLAKPAHTTVNMNVTETPSATVKRIDVEVGDVF